MKTKQKPKPRLSMKLLWKLFLEFGHEPFKTDSKLGTVKNFLEFVEEQMKPLKP